MNSDIRIAVTFLEHLKTIKLQRRHGAEAVLCLVRLWFYTAQNRPDGMLLGMDAEDIEIAAKWNGESGVFFKALIEIGWLENVDGLCRIHDWDEHQPYVVHAPARKEKARLAASARHAKRTPVANYEHASSMLQADNEQTSSMLDASLCSAPYPSPVPSPSPDPNPSPTTSGVPPGLDAQAWGKWLDYRKAIKRPVKQASMPAAQRKLAAHGALQAAVVEQSIANGWQGLFDVKQHGSMRERVDNSAPARVRRAIAERERKRQSLPGGFEHVD